MKQIKTIARNVHITPRKLSLVVKMVKSKTIQDMIDYLPLMSQNGARILYKTLKTAVADAKANYSLAINKLQIKEIKIDKGSVMKRWRPVSRGRAHSYRRQTSILTIVLEETK